MLWQSIRLTSIFVNFNLLKSSGHTAQRSLSRPADEHFAKILFVLKAKLRLKLRDKNKTTTKQQYNNNCQLILLQLS